MTSTSAEALVIDGLSKRYGKARTALMALDGVHLKIGRGQLYGLIGHNGAGKSTTMKMIAPLVMKKSNI